MSRKLVGSLFHRLIPVVALVVLLASTIVLGLESPETVAADEPVFDWIRQFGSGGFDYGYGVAVDSSGIYVVGGRADGGFVSRYDVDGNAEWERDIDHVACAVAADSTAGYVVDFGNFVRKYDANGNELWAPHMDDDDYAYAAQAISTDASGIYVAGMIFKSSSQPNPGAIAGMFVRKYDASGDIAWTHYIQNLEFGLGACWGVSACSTGIYVGVDTGGEIDAERNLICKCDANGNQVWLHQIGLAGIDISADASGIYVAGVTIEPHGFNYGVVGKYDADGNESWTRQISLSVWEQAYAVSAYAGGIYVGGSVEGALPGQTSQGETDAFVCEYDTDGNLSWIKQFGSDANDWIMAVSAGATGVYLTGMTAGTLPGCSSQGADDAFLLRMTVDSTPNTPVGAPVTVSLDCATVTFGNVTVAGSTSCTSQQGNSGGGIPQGFMLRGQFVDIVITATYNGPVTVGISYEPSTRNPRNLKLFHWEGGHWVDVTTWVDTTTRIVYGEVGSLQ